jgi:cation diffusion facilitator CzcD-associated flavoprotein CzcO
MPSTVGIANPLLSPFLFLYQLIQWIIAKALSPNPPKSNRELKRPKVAIIGAGITGVSAAAHCVGHGFDVVIFEAGTEDSVGGIWTVRTRPLCSQVVRNDMCCTHPGSCSTDNPLQRVNDTSGLQINSIMYRFHPSVQWSRGYPDRKQIVDQVRQLWRRYGLEGKTRFGVKVDKVYQDDLGRWVVNDTSHGHFEGLVCAVGTCGAAKMPTIPGMDKFKGEVYHSSQLTG